MEVTFCAFCVCFSVKSLKLMALQQLQEVIGGGSSMLYGQQGDSWLY